MTYGWVRTEVLGGLINGVLLVALCFNIALEAVQRFFEPQGNLLRRISFNDRK
jgi:zinc transporter 1